jgi:hypothetical protein
MPTYIHTKRHSKLVSQVIAAACLVLHSAVLLSQTSLHNQQAIGDGAVQLRLHNSESISAMRPSRSLALEPSTDSGVSALERPASIVLFQSGSVSIQSKGGSLSQILHEISDASGMQMEGMKEDEQVFGNFGPGEPQEVLSALLNGSRYNVVMVGRLSDGAPRILLLSGRNDAIAQTPAQPVSRAAAPKEPPAPEEIGSPVVPEAAPIATPDASAAPQKTPEETLEELQRLQSEHPHS